MKRKIFISMLVMGMLLVLAFSSVQAAAGYRLVAGQNQIVGWVFVENDATNIYITFQTKYGLGFCLNETHLHVADTWEEIPQNNGNPTPGQFDYKGEHDCEQTVMYTVPLNGWGPGDEVAIAAHAVVGNWRDPDWEETGWGVVCGNINNNQFPGANWAVFAPYTIH